MIVCPFISLSIYNKNTIWLTKKQVSILNNILIKKQWENLNIKQKVL